VAEGQPILLTRNVPRESGVVIHVSRCAKIRTAGVPGGRRISFATPARRSCVEPGARWYDRFQLFASNDFFSRCSRCCMGGIRNSACEYPGVPPGEFCIGCSDARVDPAPENPRRVFTVGRRAYAFLLNRVSEGDARRRPADVRGVELFDPIRIAGARR